MGFLAVRVGAEGVEGWRVEGGGGGGVEFSVRSPS